MCANCGCKAPEDKHGDERNILWSDIEAAARANDQTPQQALENMTAMARDQVGARA